MKKSKLNSDEMGRELFAAKTEPLVATPPPPPPPPPDETLAPPTMAAALAVTRPPVTVPLMLRIQPELCYWLDQEAKRRSETSWKRVTTQQVILELCVAARAAATKVQS